MADNSTADNTVTANNTTGPDDDFYAPLSHMTLCMMFTNMICVTGEESAAIPRETLIGEIRRLSEVARVQNAIAGYEAAEKRGGYEVDVEAEDRDAARYQRIEGETGGTVSCRSCGQPIDGAEETVGPHSYHPGCAAGLMTRTDGLMTRTDGGSHKR